MRVSREIFFLILSENFILVSLMNSHEYVLCIVVERKGLCLKKEVSECRTGAEPLPSDCYSFALMVNAST